MGIETITVALNGTTVVPASDESWREWVSATALRGYLGGDTLGDWLGYYGTAHGYVRDDELPDYDKRLDFPSFVMGKGGDFERAIAAYLGQRASLVLIEEGREATRSLENAERTFELLCAGQQIVHQAVLRDAETRTYGLSWMAVDTLIRTSQSALPLRV